MMAARKKTTPAETQPTTTTPPADTGFDVEITAEVVNVRSGSALGFDIVTTLRKGTVVRIAEELSDGWGRLASGAGYINLIFATRI